MGTPSNHTQSVVTELKYSVVYLPLHVFGFSLALKVQVAERSMSSAHVTSGRDWFKFTVHSLQAQENGESQM